MRALYTRVLDGKGGGREATEAELAAGLSDDGVLWVHLNYADEQTAPWLADVVGLSDVLVQALMAEEPRPRSLVSGPGVLVVLRGINTGEGADPEDMVSVRLWVEERRVVTMRHRVVAAVQDVLGQIDRNVGPIDAGDLLHEIADRMLDRIAKIVASIEDAADDMEEQVLTASGREMRTQLSDLRRKSIAIRRYIVPQRDTLARLHTERIPWLTDLARARLRESAERITRHVETLDSARERAAITHEELTNRLAEQMNQTMYTLSVVAAIFLPLGLLTGLLGINVGGIPGTESSWAFPAVTGALVLIGYLEWLWFRSRSVI